MRAEETGGAGDDGNWIGFFSFFRMKHKSRWVLLSVSRGGVNEKRKSDGRELRRKVKSRTSLSGNTCGKELSNALDGGFVGQLGLLGNRIFRFTRFEAARRNCGLYV